MWVTANNEKAAEIDSVVVKKILGMYPEEKLAERPVFQNAFDNDLIEFRSLRNESDKVLIPWQMFLLNLKNLNTELKKIEAQRIDRISSKLLSKRKGLGDTTSKRIIDRLIRLQNFICDNNQLPLNAFCGSLKSKTDDEAVAHIISYFGIDLTEFRKKNKADALKYLIARIEVQNINISQGVLANKMLPTWQVVNNTIYKNTSGFVIKDDSLPFIFLPSEINPDETDGRQIYTLIYLLVVIGLDQYSFFLEKDFKAKAVAATGALAKIHRITSKLLLPVEETAKLNGTTITAQIRDDLAATYKITASAVVVTLRIRNVIKTKAEYTALLPAPMGSVKKSGHVRSPAIETSVKKFCGKHSFDFINAGIKSASITNVQAQYLLLGAVNKKNFKNYRTRLKI